MGGEEKNGEGEDDGAGTTPSEDMTVIESCEGDEVTLRFLQEEEDKVVCVLLCIALDDPLVDE